MSPDPEDLNVETPEDYQRFAELAERQELAWMKDYTLTREALCIEEGLSEWELEFVIAMGNKMKEEHETEDRAGLSHAQRTRLSKILERLGK